ncbi:MULTISPECIES: outer membrane beta-barrel protein [unclassified Roseitalea]|uniref:outer membrane protein n=1 Tax=unclassified Roseitalea TaxID=2639107 RepID=UPI00273D9D32|nr:MULTISPECIES: outer membrane beta-barrel protein [unclassified Roseitalea]
MGVARIEHTVRFSAFTVSIAAAGLVGLMGTDAGAADVMIYQDPAPGFVEQPFQPVVFNWTSLYAGAHVGYATGGKTWTQTFSSAGTGPLAIGAPVDYDMAGLTGGAQVGFNYQPSGSPLVFGAEATISLGDLADSGDSVTFAGYTKHSDIKWMGTATAKAGYAFDRVLVYAKGGFAFANEDFFIAFNGVQDTDTVSTTRTGWTFGAGAEWAIDNRWSVRAEYAYVDFGASNHEFTYPAGSTSPGLTERFDIDQHMHTFGIGVNYHFRP